MGLQSVIGALRIVIGADNAVLETNLKTSEEIFKNFRNSILKIGAGLGIAKVLSDTSSAIRRTITDMDEASKSAARLGLSTEDFTRLSYAADLSGISTDQLRTSMEKLSRGVGEAVQGVGEFQSVAKQYGIALVDASGKTRSQVDILDDLADRLKNAGSSQEQMRIAVQAFGRSGASMINLLGGGSDALRKMTTEADTLGIVFSGSTGRAAEEFNDTLTRINKIANGLLIQTTASLLPALQALAGMFLSGAKSAVEFQKGTTVVSEFFDELVRQIAIASVTIDSFSARFQVWSNVLSALKNLDFEGVNKAAEGFATIDERAKNFNLEVAKTILAWKLTGQAAAQTAPQINNVSTAYNLASQKISETTQKMIEQQGAHLTEEMLNPYEQYAIKLDKLNWLLGQGQITLETWSRAVQKAADDANLSFGKVAEGVSGAFTEITNSIGGSTSKAAKIAQVAAAAVALVNVFSAQTFALAQPFPANLAAVATVAAKGAALIAAISAVKMPSAAMGGDFIVPGGTSGTDNRVVPMHLASGERVSVTPASQSGGGRSQTIVVQGLTPEELWSGRMVREFANRLLELQRDGLEIVL